MRVFLRTNTQGKYDIRIKAKKDPHKNVWMLSHMIAQLARFGMLDLKIEGEEKTPVLLAKSIGEEIGRAMKDKLNRKKGHSLFLWPHEQSLAIVLVDLSRIKKPYSITRVEGCSTEERKMTENFCQGLAKEAQTGILFYIIDTDRFSRMRPGMMYNTHHQLESSFKALGRTLRELTEKRRVKIKPPQTIEKFKRTTLETDIEIKLRINGTGKSKIDLRAKRDPDKNIKFLKIYLQEFTKAGNFDLFIKGYGDDEHHLYEDLMISLGNLFNKILGERKGIMRTSWSIHPLKGGMIILALDLGRGYCQIETDIKNLSLQSMVHHCFESLSRFTKIDMVAFGVKNNHPFITYLEPVLVKALNGPQILKRKEKELNFNDRELSRVLFRALGKTLKEAMSRDPLRQNEIPSTKGLL